MATRQTRSDDDTKQLKRAVSDEDKEQRRRTILAAAKQVFAEKGFHATTIADVARAAGLSYGSIYWYFDSKEALFHALMDAEQRELRRYVARTVRELAPASDEPAGDERAERRAQRRALRDGVRAIFEFFEQDRAATTLLFRDSISLGGGIEAHLYGIYERFIDDIERMIVQAQQAGVVMDAPSRMIAFTVGGLIGQIAIRRLMTDDGFGADEVADFVVHLVLDGIRAA